MHVDPTFMHPLLHLRCMTDTSVYLNSSSIMVLARGVSSFLLYLLKFCFSDMPFSVKPFLSRLKCVFVSLQNTDSAALRAFSAILCDLVIQGTLFLWHDSFSFFFAPDLSTHTSLNHLIYDFHTYFVHFKICHMLIKVAPCSFSCKWHLKDLLLIPMMPNWS